MKRILAVICLVLLFAVAGCSSQKEETAPAEKQEQNGAKDFLRGANEEFLYKYKEDINE